MKIATRPASATKQRKKGFTLTEIAIVLGIIGLILGAIWVAASSVYSNQKVAKANTQILTVLQGVRSLYSTSANVGSDGDITSALCSAGVFPSDTVASGGCSATAISNPWNGTTKVKSTSSATAGTGDLIEITMASVPTSACIALFTSLGGSGRDSGLYYVDAKTDYVSAAGAGGATSYAGGAAPISVTNASAATECTNAATNPLYFVFKLKG